MIQQSNISSSGMHVVNDYLVVPISSESDEDDFKRIGEDILDYLKTSRLRGVLINMSAVSILGSYGFSILRNTAKAVAMMGNKAVFVGFQPGVASSLVDLETDFTDILTAVTIKDAFELLDPVVEKPQSKDEQDEAGEADMVESNQDNGN